MISQILPSISCHWREVIKNPCCFPLQYGRYLSRCSSSMSTVPTHVHRQTVFILICILILTLILVPVHRRTILRQNSSLKGMCQTPTTPQRGSRSYCSSTVGWCSPQPVSPRPTCLPAHAPRCMWLLLPPTCPTLTCLPAYASCCMWLVLRFTTPHGIRHSFFFRP